MLRTSFKLLSYVFGCIATLVCAVVFALPAQAYNPGPYMVEVYTNYPSTFNGAWAWVSNPNFNAHIDDGAGSWFGYSVIAQNDNALLSMGFSIGQIFAGTSAFTGTFVDNDYLVNGIGHETFYPIQSPGPSGTSSFWEEQSTTAYKSVAINGTTVVSNLYETDAQEGQMTVGLNEQDTSPSTDFYFPNFTSGSSISGMQTYYTSWGNWPCSGAYVGSETQDPVDQTSAYSSYSNDCNADYFYIYP